MHRSGALHNYHRLADVGSKDGEGNGTSVIVLILVLIWLVVLTPAIMHRLSSSDVVSSVVRFRSDTRLLRKILGHREDVIPLASNPVGASGLSHRERALRAAERERTRRERHRTMARRRRVILVVLLVTFGSLGVGAVSELHLLWTLSAVFALLLIAYLVLIARITKNAVNAIERNAKVIRMPQTVFPVAFDGLADDNESADRRMLALVAGEAR